MVKIGFGILHYLTYDYTCKCVESIIKNIDTKDYVIVIIDNGSKNGTGERLLQKYQDNDKVKVIINANNEGFSKGNNLAFHYLKSINCEYICLINNDTEIISNDFVKQIDGEYKKSKCAVMGPKIILKNNQIEKVCLKLITKEELVKQIRRTRTNLVLNYLHLETLKNSIKGMIKKVIKYKTKIIDNNNYPRTESVVLHGCFLIFTPSYITNFDGLNERTFLYKEEEFLYLQIKKLNLISIYNPNIVIYHDEDASTNMLTKKPYKKRRFIYKYNLIACKELLKEME